MSSALELCSVSSPLPPLRAARGAGRGAGAGIAARHLLEHVQTISNLTQSKALNMHASIRNPKSHAETCTPVENQRCLKRKKFPRNRTHVRTNHCTRGATPSNATNGDATGRQEKSAPGSGLPKRLPYQAIGYSERLPSRRSLPFCSLSESSVSLSEP